MLACQKYLSSDRIAPFSNAKMFIHQARERRLNTVALKVHPNIKHLIHFLLINPYHYQAAPASSMGFSAPAVFCGSSFSTSSALVSRCKKLLSLTGLPLWPWEVTPIALLLCGVDECGMFSGTGCSRPIVVTPASDALPALESA
jgi:hypothetical protein